MLLCVSVLLPAGDYLEVGGTAGSRRGEMTLKPFPHYSLQGLVNPKARKTADPPAKHQEFTHDISRQMVKET